MLLFNCRANIRAIFCNSSEKVQVQFFCRAAESKKKAERKYFTEKARDHHFDCTKRHRLHTKLSNESEIPCAINHQEDKWTLKTKLVPPITCSTGQGLEFVRICSPWNFIWSFFYNTDVWHWLKQTGGWGLSCAAGSEMRIWQMGRLISCSYVMMTQQNCCSV